MKIKQKLTCAFAFIACIPVFFVSVLVIAYLRSQSLEHFADSSGRELRQVDKTMEGFFDSISESVSYLAQDPEIREAGGLKQFMGADAPSIAEPEINKTLFSRFDRFAKSHPGTAYLTFGMSDGGFVTWPAEPDMANYDPRKRPWYQAALAKPGQTVRTGAYLNVGEHTDVLISSVHTVNNPDGTPKGVIGLDVSLGNLTSLINRIRLGESGYVMLVEASGKVLVDPKNEAHSFKQLESLGEGYSALAQIKDGTLEVSLAGVPYVANVISSPDSGWRFIGLIQREEVMADASRLMWWIVAIALGLAATFAFIGAGFAGVIVRPIHSVSLGLREVAQGECDLTRSLTVQGHDETATLAGWFNHFLTAISQLIHVIGLASQRLQGVSAESHTVATTLSAVSGRQREAVDLVSTAFHEMVATANEVARACSQAATAADAGRKDVQVGQQQIDEATDSVGHLGSKLEQADRAIQELDKHSRNINGILDTISSIAEQTNLLALNAAIEAARAGDQGRGFAVVADEVRALARRTAESTGEIDSLLGALANGTQSVSRQMHQSLEMSSRSVAQIQLARGSFEKIRDSVDSIRDQSAQIATAAEEQHHVAEEINQHIAQIHKDAQEVDELAQQAHADAASLRDVSAELSGHVSRFKY